MLQSLFTWIFYLFKVTSIGDFLFIPASILIHLDFLSILTDEALADSWYNCFNPYSPGFSIYLIAYNILKEKKQASILIHLDFLSIWEINKMERRGGKSFNPYSPGFSIYFNYFFWESDDNYRFNPYSPGFSIYLSIYIVTTR